MALGYIGSLNSLQAGNQQLVNNMVGLGQQISSAIQTNAAQQSAKAMLPMLQQQVVQIQQHQLHLQTMLLQLDLLIQLLLRLML